jgi:diacylglycerol kinase (ATP)
MRILVVVNPASGGGRGQARFERAWSEAPLAGAGVEIAYTERPGHATDLAREAAASGAESVLAVGGDGTISEVANGLVRTSTALAVVPTGTGCDFARSLGVPSHPAAALRALASASRRSVDLGRLADRYFVNAAGLGFDAEVAREVNVLKERTSATGTWPYLLALSRVLRTYRGPEVQTVADGACVTGRVLLITLANGRYYGGGIRISPRSDLSDGQLDMVRVDDLRPAGVAALLPRAYLGRHVGHPAVHVTPFHHLALSPAEPTLVHCDGDLWRVVEAGETVEVQSCRDALTCLVPAA